MNYDNRLNWINFKVDKILGKILIQVQMKIF